MKSRTNNIEKLSIELKKELNNPKLNNVKRVYIVEKIKLIGEYIVNKNRSGSPL